jgi:hypothetical protein
MYEMFIELLKGPHGSLVVAALIIGVGLILACPCGTPKRRYR